ncbi:MAG: chloride channel protein [Candidatus Acidiferrales bacterium]
MSEASLETQAVGSSLEAEPQGLRGASRKFWRAWLGAFRTIPETQFFLLLAIVIGLFSGLVVVCFRICIEWTSILLLGSGMHPSMLRTLLVPSICGLLVAILALRVFPRVRGSGVNQTKAAVYIYDGYVPFSTVIGKFITCALSIGSGQSLGPEDPALQMGAGIASKLGRGLHLSQEKLRLIAPVGAAAGLAAAFNAPVSAVLFVIEEVIGNWSGGVLGAVVLAAVSSVVVMRRFMGSEALFRIPPFEVQHPAELLAYAVLGIVGGGASLVLLKFIGWARPRLMALPTWSRYLQPAGAGLLIGIIGIWLPQVMGAGYPIIDQALHDQYTWEMLLLLGAFKILATGFSFTSGTPGGMFAPALFIGAMIGGAVGGIEHHFFHGLTGTVGAFALVGMGTLFAGFLRIPITSVFMVIEVSGNYSAILPVMISNGIAYLISRHYQSVPLFDMLSRQDGVVLPSVEQQRERVNLRVEDAMRIPVDDAQREDESFEGAVRRAIATEKGNFLVRLKSGEWAIIEPGALERLAAAPASPMSPILEEQVDTRRPPTLYPDQTLEEALHSIQDWAILPVVNRADLHRLEGVLALEDVLAAYRKRGPG